MQVVAGQTGDLDFAGHSGGGEAVLHREVEAAGQTAAGVTVLPSRPACADLEDDQGRPEHEGRHPVHRENLAALAAVLDLVERDHPEDRRESPPSRPKTSVAIARRLTGCLRSSVRISSSYSSASCSGGMGTEGARPDRSDMDLLSEPPDPAEAYPTERRGKVVASLTSVKATYAVGAALGRLLAHAEQGRTVGSLRGEP